MICGCVVRDVAELWLWLKELSAGVLHNLDVQLLLRLWHIDIMTQEQGASKRPRKMSRLPKGDNYYQFLLGISTHTGADYKVEKRPLLRPPITSQYANADVAKVVYVSTKTPFMSAVKRVQKLLAQAEKRLAQSAADQVSNRPKYSHTNVEIMDIERVAATMAAQKNDQDEIVLKATGKAIAKALSLALWFQQRIEYNVRIETGTVGAIDDIVPPEDAPEDEDQNMKDGEEDIPGSRIRYASTIQIFVSAAS